MSGRIRFLITAVPVLLALGSPRASAQSQNPYTIDGTIGAPNNSGVTAAPANAAPCVTGAGGSTQACMITDPDGNTQEPGPINSNTTKIGVINTAPTPMLGSTNPNGNTDLNTIFSQTTKTTLSLDHDLWYYFGWVRDSAGTGFIALEFEHNPIDAGCMTNSTPPVVNYTLATCNPWKGRQGGTGANADFVLVWDQSGNSTQIIKRNFVCSDGSAKCTGAKVVLATCPNVITSTNPLDACHQINPADAVASFGLPAPNNHVSNDASRGEVAIDLTTQIFTGGTCQSFANIIPGTVTGNSDSADYKDVVLSAFPPVSNCGTVTITKTTDPAGLVGTFNYTLAAGGGDIFALGGVNAACADSANTTQCVGTLTTTAQGGDTDTITGLLEHGTTWTLVESSPAAAGFSIKSIDCTDGNGGTYHLAGTTPTVSSFKVEAGLTTACTIVNQVVKTTPLQSTVQTGFAQIKDRINFTGIKPGASDANQATATFTLYTNSTCTTSVFGTPTSAIALVYDTATTAHAVMTTTVEITPGASNVYHWRVTYNGDAFNNGFTTPCSEESATVTFTFTP